MGIDFLLSSREWFFNTSDDYHRSGSAHLMRQHSPCCSIAISTPSLQISAVQFLFGNDMDSLKTLVIHREYRFIDTSICEL
jgi:hypothetical protein